MLDAGSGEGYGAFLLAATAARVVGMDISEEAVENARESYRRPNLEYRTGAIESLPFDDGSFDVVVSFEVIEHLDPELQTAFLHEARRVLHKDGILIISTPNKAVYTDRTGCHNRFHKKEFYVDEFKSFLMQCFPHVSMFAQSWFVSSVLEKAGSGNLQSLELADPLDGPPKYVIAVCGATGYVDGIALASVVIDRRGKYEAIWQRILELQAEVAAKNDWALSLEQDVREGREAVARYQKEAEDRYTWILSLKEEIKGIEEALAHYRTEAGELAQEIKRVEQVLDHYKSKAAELDGRLDKARRHVDDLKAQNDSLANILKGKEAELGSARTELDLIKQSDFWRIASRYWQWRDSILPPGSRRRRVMRRLVGALKKSGQAPDQPSRTGETEPESGASEPLEDATPAAMADAQEMMEPIEFPEFERPKISIIIPAFNQWSHTYRCIRSVRRTMGDLSCEVILADDGSTDATARARMLLPGVKVLRDGTNRGFLQNCNRAAAQARGEYLYFLNNDTELQFGAIQSLASLLDRQPSAGMAGSKLVYPNGRLQEAGGIIWADGSGWNFGRGQDAASPAFNYVKEVDYVSGASFMIRSDLWKVIGGFDEQFTPAYCEDSDLAFEVRRRGFKVFYQPQSVVVHFEGASHGTDVSHSTKAYQVRNTQILKSKWADTLAGQFPNGTNVFQARDRSGGRKTVLMIDHYVPQFDRDAGSRTIWSFIQAFLGLGINVKFMGDNFFPHQPYTDVLQQAGVEVLTGPWFADNWPEWLAENGRWLNYVFLSRPHIAPKYLRSIRRSTNARIFYYVHDLHYLRESKLAEINHDADARVRADRCKAEEQYLMSRMDVVFSCSQSETRLIQGLCPNLQVFYVPPYALDVDLTGDYDPGRRADLLFVGGFSHPPNADGVLWFVREVWPAVRRHLPGVKFNIAGAEPPREILSLASDDVKVLGFVSDERLQELYRTARLVVVPLRYGAGVKGKTVEAMAYGVPVVCTEYGIEGMPEIENAVDPAQYRLPMAEGINGLYSDVSRLIEISRKQRAYVAGHFTIERIQETFARATAHAK